MMQVANLFSINNQFFAYVTLIIKFISKAKDNNIK
jgi:hypothetical protein